MPIEAEDRRNQVVAVRRAVGSDVAELPAPVLDDALAGINSHGGKGAGVVVEGEGELFDVVRERLAVEECLDEFVGLCRK